MSDILDIFVIIRETGEYSDRSVEAIRFVLTEEEAQAAVERAQVEGKTLKRPPYPDIESPLGHQLPDGTWLPEHADFMEARRLGAVLTRKPNADELSALGERAREEYRRACLAMGCVDPTGPADYATYSYEIVSRYVLQDA